MKIIQEECRGCISLTRKTSIYGLEEITKVDHVEKNDDEETIAENIRNNHKIREAVRTYICSFEIEVESIEKLYEDCPCQNCIVKTLCLSGCDIFSDHIRKINTLNKKTVDF